MRKRIVAAIIAAMTALSLVPTPALAYIAPSEYKNYPTNLEYRLNYTEKWRRLPKYTKAGVTYRLNAKTHRAIVTRVSVNNANIPNRFRAGGVWYYPDIIDEDAVSRRCKRLTIHGSVYMLDYCALTWCQMTFTDKFTYKTLRGWCGTWAKDNIKYHKCKDCVKHRNDYWRTHGSSVL
jgi:hypothetical protein